MSAPVVTNLDDGSDDEDDDHGWLAAKFELRPPPISANNHLAERRPLDANGFEDSFVPGMDATASFDNHFTFDDDHFGPFSDAAAVPGETNPFTYATVASEADEAGFEGFGEFGDFQGADGEMTPTAGSWSFASDASISSGSDDVEVIEAERIKDESSSSDPVIQDKTRTDVLPTNEASRT